MKKLSNLFKLFIIATTLSLVIFQYTNYKVDNRAATSIKSILNKASATSESGEIHTHHFCWPCVDPYNQGTIQVDCQESGTPGCYWAQCGYNYACENV